MQGMWAPVCHLLSAMLATIPVSRDLIAPSPDGASEHLTPAAAAALPSAALEAPSLAEVTLHVVRVLDDELPPISDQDMALILAVARETLAEKLSFDQLRLVDHGVLSAERFFADNPPSAECRARLAPLRFDPWAEPDFAALRPQMLAFLQRWQLPALRAYFPADQAGGLDTYDALLDRLLPAYRQKVRAIRDLRLPSGRSLLAPDKAELRSYVGWICVLAAQARYDLILTNQFVLYDLASEPYPHSVLKKCKVGGASLRSPARGALAGRALFASTFGMETDVPFLAEDPGRTLSRAERQRVTGMFILAHELGHALFKLPDFYDHPPQCLMTTTAESDYLAGYRQLQAHPGPCPACKVYVDARRLYFQALAQIERGQYAAAIAALKQVVAQTPKHIDGSYRTYLADIGVHIARAHFLAGQPEEGQRWLSSALAMDPQYEPARRLKAGP